MGVIPVFAESQAIDAGDFVQAEAGGDTFVNDGRTALWFLKVSGASVQVDVASVRACRHGFTTSHVDLPLTVNPSGAMHKTRTFPVRRFGHTGQVSYSGDASGLLVVAVRQEGMPA